MAAQRITTAEARTRGPDLDQPQNRPNTYEQRRRGRPSEYGPDKVRRVAELVDTGWTVKEIADEIGVTTQTLYSWAKDFPDFFTALRGGRDQRDERVVNALYDKATNGDNTAMIFWLKNRRPKDWNDRQQIELSGSVEIKQDDRQLALAMLDLLRGAMDAPMTIEHDQEEVNEDG